MCKQGGINIFLVKTKEMFVSGKGFDDEASDYSVGTWKVIKNLNVLV